MSTAWVIMGEEASIIAVTNCASKIKPFILRYAERHFSAESTLMIRKQLETAKFSAKDFRSQTFRGDIDWEFIDVYPEILITRADHIIGEGA